MWNTGVQADCRACRECGVHGKVAKSGAGGDGRNAHGRRTPCLSPSRRAEQGWRWRQEAWWQGQGLTARCVLMLETPE